MRPASEKQLSLDVLAAGTPRSVRATGARFGNVTWATQNNVVAHVQMMIS